LPRFPKWKIYFLSRTEMACLDMTHAARRRDLDLTPPCIDAAPAPTLLMVPGLNGSCAVHWQSAWERVRDDCARAELGQWSDPTPAQWTRRLDRAVQAVAGPVVLVAHSLGCIATALWARDHAPEALDHAPEARVLGALLVAPCDPEAADACGRLNRFAPVPRARLPFPAMVVASSNDPYATLDRSRAMAAAWGAAFVDVGARGHINAHSALEAWPEGQDILAGFLRSLS
jgi:predicted alpha/beta hydrolase family esterase